MHTAFQMFPSDVVSMKCFFVCFFFLSWEVLIFTHTHKKYMPPWGDIDIQCTKSHSKIVDCNSKQMVAHNIYIFDYILFLFIYGTIKFPNEACSEKAKAENIISWVYIAEHIKINK